MYLMKFFLRPKLSIFKIYSKSCSIIIKLNNLPVKLSRFYPEIFSLLMMLIKASGNLIEFIQLITYSQVH